MTGLPPSEVRTLTMAEIDAYAEIIDAEITARKLAARRGRRR
jgi:hypothetical protein